MIDVAFITEQRYISPNENSWYTSQIILEDSYLLAYLQNQGLRVKRLDWRASHDWSKIGCVLLRTPWNYFDYYEEFKQWITTIESKTKILNPPALLHWNFDKKYLLDLSQKGVDIVPTKIFPIHSEVKYDDLFSMMEAETIVIKPTISGAAKDTFRLHKKEPKPDFIDGLFQKHAMMIQPFMEKIITFGEISTILFSESPSHSILKTVQDGDFRVQDDHGGQVSHYTATNQDLLFTKKTLQACPEQPVYARVDYTYDSDGNQKLMELELIEPELFLRSHPQGAEIFGSSILDRL